jgi:membrane glycosyltransferase
VNALVCAIANDRRRLPDSIRRDRTALAQEAVLRGPESLTADQRTRLLSDPFVLSYVHSHLWLAASGAVGAPSAP